MIAPEFGIMQGRIINHHSYGIKNHEKWKLTISCKTIKELNKKELYRPCIETKSRRKFKIKLEIFREVFNDLYLYSAFCGSRWLEVRDNKPVDMRKVRRLMRRCLSS